MNETEIIRDITDTFAGIQIASAGGNSFFYYGPDGKIPEKTFPFATLVTTDEYDSVSDLSRPGVYRLNIGLSRDSYQSLLGPVPAAPGDSGVVATGDDFTTLDRIMPHPIYGHMAWICVLNPGEKSLATVKALLEEAYRSAVSKVEKRKTP